MPNNEDVNLILRCRELSDIAMKARDTLCERMTVLGKSSHVYTFKHRVKPAGAVLAKVNRKKSERPASPDDTSESYEPDHVTDAWGCRYVTLYQSQIPPTVAGLLADFDAFNKGRVDRVDLIEFIIYTNRPTKDPLSIVGDTLGALKSSELYKSMRSPELVREPENRKSAYSSVHLVFALPVTVEHAGRGATREVARFEVQVRDIFEEGWGEIQHDLIYSDKDRPKLAAEVDTSFDPLWQPHLNALKTFVDGCSQHASIIKSSYEFIMLRSMPSIETKSATSQTTDRDAIVAVLASRASAVALNAIKVAYSQILDAQESGSRDEARANYLAAAAKFEEALGELGDLVSTPVPGCFDHTVEYFLRIEYANCLYFSRIEGEQRKAVAIYEELARAYAQDPTVRLRLAIALASTANRDRSILTRAIDLTKQAIPLIDDDPLTGPTHWLAISCHVHLGFLYWKLFEAMERNASREEILDLLRSAAASTQKASRMWAELSAEVQGQDTYVLTAHKAMSNLLYYAAKFYRIETGDDTINRDLIEDTIAKLTALEIPKYREYYKTRDNIMHALSAIGKRDGARQMARDNVNELKKLAETRARRQLISTEIDGFLDEDEQRNYRAAAAVIADADASA